MLDYLQDKYNIPIELRTIIKKEMDFLDQINLETKRNKKKYNEVVLYIKYYSFINMKINRRKKTQHTIISSIKHFD